METKADIEQMISLYQLTYPGEQANLASLILFLQNTSGNDLFSRHNFNGHITASAFVVDEKVQSLLLIHHKKLGRWLQPGGHVDVSDPSLREAAIRETTEETGLSPADLRHLAGMAKNNIFDVDSHLIPANINKNEPEHLHHDLRFIFVCTNPKSLVFNAEEAFNIEWRSIASLMNDETFGSVAQKIGQLLQQFPQDIATDKLV